MTSTICRALIGIILAIHVITGVDAAEIPPGELTTTEIADIVRQQAAELAAQRALIDEQRAALESQQQLIRQQQQELAAQREALNSLRPGEAVVVSPAATAPVAAAGTSPPATGAPGQVAETSDKPSGKPAPEQSDDPLLGYDPSKFPGGFPLPGTAAALRIGGYVKANVVQSFESVGSQDRFIVGSIPTDPAVRGDSEAALTASQSRLNFELREESEVGQFRAFIEGDFAGDGDSFRLRHAFGQYGQVLAGKTWSTFMDTEASPEEVDFEGINGRLNARRTQLRYFPAIGQEWNMAVALEDPVITVLNGEGLSQIPDVIASAKRSVRGPLLGEQLWHLKVAALFRNIRARPTVNPEAKESATGWGLSLSGRTYVSTWDERDSLMLQVNYGQGYASYVNDLSTVSVPDAVFDPLTGTLDTVEALSWYLAFQHWWKPTIRSNFILSNVVVEEQDFVVSDEFGENYESTWRLSGNVIWSPVRRVDVGAELLWGQRRNQDGPSGNATQLQLSMKYLF